MWFNLAERDKKHTMIDLRGVPANWSQNQLRPSRRPSRLCMGSGGRIGSGDLKGNRGKGIIE
jgi:hypothetical protein